MNYSFEFSAALLFVVLASVGWIAVKLLNISPPVVYGRHETGQFRLRVPTRLSWMLMESPACLVFAWFVFTGPLPVTAPVWAVFMMWQLHYVHRAFIYPFQLHIRPGSSTPARMTLFGGVICALGGYLNGDFISRYAVYLQSNEWFYTPEFIVGFSLFVIGYVINKVSDITLITLRKENPDAYSIPYGGMYRFVSCPNYLGEIITWVGFACAAWSIAGAVFAFMTATNLIFRALENHQWYKEKFPDYPKNRKAIIPFIL